MGSVGEVAPALAVSPPLFDCLIIGGGLAGLSAATSLVRTLHTAIVFDAGSHRNDAAPHLATIPTWDSKDPARFREETIRNLQNKYSTVQFADVGLEKIEKVTSNEHPLLFRATDGKQREWLGKSVILAMGVSDVLPDIPGYEDCWVKGILHCLVHRGYEERGCASAGILSVDGDANLKAAKHLAFQARNLTPVVTIYTNGNDALTAECIDELSPLGFKVDGRSIARLVKAPKRTQVAVHFADDSPPHTEGFIVHRPTAKLNGPFAEQLGVEITPMGHIKALFPFNETTVSGVYVAGDAGSPFKIGTQALVMGAFAAGGVQAQVNASNWGAVAVSTDKAVENKVVENQAVDNRLVENKAVETNSHVHGNGTKLL